MGTWRCPHCRTVQLEGPRCFLCQRSATSCGTCANFRRSVVSTVGYCALDRQREPLTGEERRPCWTAVEAGPAEGLFGDSAQVENRPPPPAPIATSTRRGGLVEMKPTRPLNTR